MAARLGIWARTRENREYTSHGGRDIRTLSVYAQALDTKYGLDIGLGTLTKLHRQEPESAQVFSQTELVPVRFTAVSNYLKAPKTLRIVGKVTCNTGNNIQVKNL